MQDTQKKPSFSANFPLAAAVIAQFRQAFGPGVVTLYVLENGREVGKPHDESRFTVIEGRDICIPPKPESTQHGH